MKDKIDLTSGNIITKLLIVANVAAGPIRSVQYVLLIKVSCAAYGGGYCWYLGTTLNANCNAECLDIGLDCVTNAMYGPDRKSDGTVFRLKANNKEYSA